MPNGVVTHCMSCGKQHPPEHNKKFCSECRGWLTPRRCTRCHELKSTKEGFYSVYNNTEFTPECKECRKKRKVEQRMLRTHGTQSELDRVPQRRQEALAIEENNYAAFKEAIKDRKFLSEAEWYETCSFFGGCALCGEPHIEVRMPWLTPDEGGGYVKYNMIPMCGSCNKKIPTTQHSFRWLYTTGILPSEAKEKLRAFFDEVMKNG